MCRIHVIKRQNVSHNCNLSKVYGQTNPINYSLAGQRTINLEDQDLLVFSRRAPKEYAGAFFFVGSWLLYPVAFGSPYLPGPGPAMRLL